jgi:hypothetical protein
MNLNPRSRPIVWMTLLLASLLGLSTQAMARKTQTQKAPAAKSAPSAASNDFPTQARVEYVMQCMAERGGSNLDNMYHCVCAVDKIASLMNYQDYSESLTFTYMFDTPGDKGGEFRDPPKSKELRDRLKNAKTEADACFPALPTKLPAPATK